MTTELMLRGTATDTPEGAGEAAIVAREQTEIQSAIVTAKRFPRNEQQAFVRAVNSFNRQTMAENALYNFPRGGKTVEGPSVDCARELARIWGNIRYGLRVVRNDGDRLHIRAYALDVETNTHIEMEDEFSKLVQRRDKYSGESRWIQPDERDLRELMNRRGAIAVRNCILQVLPSDLVEDVIKTAKQTLQRDAGNALEKSREETVKALVVAFDRIGVSVSMLETYVGHKLELINADEVASLRSIHQSIKEGVAKRDEYFLLDKPNSQASAEATLSAQLKQKLSEKAPTKSDDKRELNL